MSLPLLHRFSSISFSGAGFLTVYHFGVAQCLLEQGLISIDMNDAKNGPILTGVSGGALVSSALACGISPEEGVQTSLEVAATSRTNILNIYHPGYSLIDAVEQVLTETLAHSCLGGDNNSDRMESRLGGGKLRIGMTDTRVFPPLGYNPRAYRYVDTFRTIEDIVAACVLSSYVPGVTGPLLASIGIGNSINTAVWRSQERIKELSRQNLLMDYHSQPVPGILSGNDSPYNNESGRSRTTTRISPIIFQDGGLTNVWPVVDNSTLIVTPLSAHFDSNPYICPSTCDLTSYYKVNALGQLALHTDNVQTFFDMVWSSELLQKRFAQGYDNARDFLKKENLISTVKVMSAGPAPS